MIACEFPNSLALEGSMEPIDELAVVAHFNGGQVHAVIAMLRALIQTHPDPARLLRAFEVRLEISLALTLPTAAKDSYIRGLEQTKSDLLVGWPQTKPTSGTGPEGD